MMLKPSQRAQFMLASVQQYVLREMLHGGAEDTFRVWTVSMKRQNISMCTYVGPG